MPNPNNGKDLPYDRTDRESIYHYAVDLRGSTLRIALWGHLYELCSEVSEVFRIFQILPILIHLEPPPSALLESLDPPGCHKSCHK